MAIQGPITGTPVRAPFNPAPPAAVTRVLTRFDRADLASFIAVAIDLLDVADGDTDIEENGDEGDHSFAECESGYAIAFDGPGCPIADPGGSHNGHDDDEEDDGH